MPRLGWTMETGSVAEWLKHDGDAVQAGDVIFTVESDKAVQDVEAMDSGMLHILPDAPPVNVPVPVGAVLAYLLRPGEDVTSPGGMSTPPIAVEGPNTPIPDDELGLDAPAGTPALENAGRAGSASPPEGSLAEAFASPRARRIAGELGVDWRAASGTGRSGRIVERDVRLLVEHGRPAMHARVTPLARRLAAQTGVDLSTLEAGAVGQRIERADVVAAAHNGHAEQEDREPSKQGVREHVEGSVPMEGRRAPMSRIRRITAQRMEQSAHTVAPVTLTTEADATELVLVRERIKAGLTRTELRAPTYTDLLIRLVALVLVEQPWMNCSLDDDVIVQHDGVQMGLAVDTNRGLYVPVICDAHLKSIQQIAGESTRLIGAARAGSLGADDMRGGTFTISNLGMYEIDTFTPIINLPECAILGVGRIVARPVVVDEETEEVAVRRMMVLSLTFDHRVVDGAPAARFLKQIKGWIEQPYAWLTR